MQIENASPMDSSPAFVQAKRIMEAVCAADRILVAAHASPDGDAIGSSAGLVWLLRSLGKEAVLFNASGIPDYLKWMPIPGPVVRYLSEMPFKPNLVVSLDCGDAWRLGNELSEALPRYPSINIDHHPGNPAFGSVDNWIDPGMAATGQMVALLADAAGKPLAGELAACLYVSIVTDTGSFSHGNTSADVLLLASRLIRGGLDAACIRDALDNQWSLCKTRLWGQLMQRIRLECGGRVGLCEVSLAELTEAGASKSDLEGFVEQIRRIHGVRVALLAREDSAGRTKISLRSVGNDDVREIAALFGGGGHKNASGATMDMALHKAVEAVLEQLRLTLAE